MSWTPTHAQVTVHRARNLIPKGKGGTNDAFVTIQLGKEKYQTSVKERAENPEWHEECDLPIPDSPSAVHLNLYHRNFIGLDDFLGHISLPVDEFQIYERPRSKWYPLKSKPGKKNDHKYRGEIEVKVTFIVQSKSGSQTSLSKKIKRTPSIKAVANAVGEKLKLPNRSKSFRTDSKTDLYQKKPPSAFVEPLVNAHHSSSNSVFYTSVQPEEDDSLRHKPFARSTVDLVPDSPKAQEDRQYCRSAENIHCVTESPSPKRSFLGGAKPMRKVVAPTEKPEGGEEQEQPEDSKSLDSKSVQEDNDSISYDDNDILEGLMEYDEAEMGDTKPTAVGAQGSCVPGLKVEDVDEVRYNERSVDTHSVESNQIHYNERSPDEEIVTSKKYASIPIRHSTKYNERLIDGTCLKNGPSLKSPVVLPDPSAQYEERCVDDLDFVLSGRTEQQVFRRSNRVIRRSKNKSKNRLKYSALQKSVKLKAEEEKPSDGSNIDWKPPLGPRRVQEGSNPLVAPARGIPTLLDLAQGAEKITPIFTQRTPEGAELTLHPRMQETDDTTCKRTAPDGFTAKKPPRAQRMTSNRKLVKLNKMQTEETKPGFSGSETEMEVLDEVSAPQENQPSDESRENNRGGKLEETAEPPEELETMMEHIVEEMETQVDVMQPEVEERDVVASPEIEKEDDAVSPEVEGRLLVVVARESNNNDCGSPDIQDKDTTEQTHNMGGHLWMDEYVSTCETSMPEESLSDDTPEEWIQAPADIHVEKSELSKNTIGASESGLAGEISEQMSKPTSTNEISIKSFFEKEKVKRAYSLNEGDLSTNHKEKSGMKSLFARLRARSASKSENADRIIEEACREAVTPKISRKKKITKNGNDKVQGTSSVSPLDTQTSTAREHDNETDVTEMHDQNKIAKEEHEQVMGKVGGRDMSPERSPVVQMSSVGENMNILPLSDTTHTITSTQNAGQTHTSDTDELAIQTKQASEEDPKSAVDLAERQKNTDSKKKSDMKKKVKLGRSYSLNEGDSASHLSQDKKRKHPKKSIFARFRRSKSAEKRDIKEEAEDVDKVGSVESMETQTNDIHPLSTRQWSSSTPEIKESLLKTASADDITSMTEIPVMARGTASLKDVSSAPERDHSLAAVSADDVYLQDTGGNMPTAAASVESLSSKLERADSHEKVMSTDDVQLQDTSDSMHMAADVVRSLTSTPERDDGHAMLVSADYGKLQGTGGMTTSFGDSVTNVREIDVTGMETTSYDDNARVPDADGCAVELDIRNADSAMDVSAKGMHDIEEIVDGSDSAEIHVQQDSSFLPAAEMPRVDAIVDMKTEELLSKEESNRVILSREQDKGAFVNTKMSEGSLLEELNRFTGQEKFLSEEQRRLPSHKTMSPEDIIWEEKVMLVSAGVKSPQAIWDGQGSVALAENMSPNDIISKKQGKHISAEILSEGQSRLESDTRSVKGMVPEEQQRVVASESMFREDILSQEQGRLASTETMSLGSILSEKQNRLALAETLLPEDIILEEQGGSASVGIKSPNHIMSSKRDNVHLASTEINSPGNISSGEQERPALAGIKDSILSEEHNRTASAEIIPQEVILIEEQKRLVSDESMLAEDILLEEQGRLALGDIKSPKAIHEEQDQPAVTESISLCGISSQEQGGSALSKPRPTEHIISDEEIKLAPSEIISPKTEAMHDLWATVEERKMKVLPVEPEAKARDESSSPGTQCEGKRLPSFVAFFEGRTTQTGNSQTVKLQTERTNNPLQADAEERHSTFISAAVDVNSEKKFGSKTKAVLGRAQSHDTLVATAGDENGKKKSGSKIRTKLGRSQSLNEADLSPSLKEKTGKRTILSRLKRTKSAVRPENGDITEETEDVSGPHGNQTGKDHEVSLNASEIHGNSAPQCAKEAVIVEGVTLDKGNREGNDVLGETAQRQKQISQETSSVPQSRIPKPQATKAAREVENATVAAQPGKDMTAKEQDFPSLAQTPKLQRKEKKGIFARLKRSKSTPEADMTEQATNRDSEINKTAKEEAAEALEEPIPDSDSMSQLPEGQSKTSDAQTISNDVERMAQKIMEMNEETASLKVEECLPTATRDTPCDQNEKKDDSQNSQTSQEFVVQNVTDDAEPLPSKDNTCTGLMSKDTDPTAVDQFELLMKGSKKKTFRSRIKRSLSLSAADSLIPKPRKGFSKAKKQDKMTDSPEPDISETGANKKKQSKSQLKKTESLNEKDLPQIKEKGKPPKSVKKNIFARLKKVRNSSKKTGEADDIILEESDLDDDEETVSSHRRFKRSGSDASSISLPSYSDTTSLTSCPSVESLERREYMPFKFDEIHAAAGRIVEENVPEMPPSEDAITEKVVEEQTSEKGEEELTDKKMVEKRTCKEAAGTELTNNMVAEDLVDENVASPSAEEASLKEMSSGDEASKGDELKNSAFSQEGDKSGSTASVKDAIENVILAERTPQVVPCSNDSMQTVKSASEATVPPEQLPKESVPKEAENETSLNMALTVSCVQEEIPGSPLLDRMTRMSPEGADDADKDAWTATERKNQGQVENEDDLHQNKTLKLHNTESSCLEPERKPFADDLLKSRTPINKAISEILEQTLSRGLVPSADTPPIPQSADVTAYQDEEFQPIAEENDPDELLFPTPASFPQPEEVANSVADIGWDSETGVQQSALTTDESLSDDDFDDMVERNLSPPSGPSTPKSITPDMSLFPEYRADSSTGSQSLPPEGAGEPVSPKKSTVSRSKFGRRSARDLLKKLGQHLLNGGLPVGSSKEETSKQSSVLYTIHTKPSLPSVAILPELAAAPSVEQHDVTKDADLSKQLRRSKSGSDDHSPEEADSLIHMRQPVYKAPTLRRAASDADAKFVDFSGRKRMGSAQENSETPLLTDAREMARSLGCLKEETDSAFMPNNWKSDVNGRQTSQSASASSSRLNGNSNNLKNKSSQENLNSSEAKLRDSTERLKRMKDPTRRHTLQGVELPALLTHDLHQGVGREIRPKGDQDSLPPEVIDQYRDLSREELIKMIWLQKSLVEQKNNIVHELENYIDNLLVRVMETSPRILQNPYERPSTPIQRTPSKHMTRATKISTNPLRRLQSLRLRSSKRH